MSTAFTNWMSNPLTQMGIGMLGAPSVGVGLNRGLNNYYRFNQQKEQSELRKLRAEAAKLEIDRAKEAAKQQAAFEAAKKRVLGRQEQEAAGPPNPDGTPNVIAATGLYAKDPQMAAMLELSKPQNMPTLMMQNRSFDADEAYRGKSLGLQRDQLNALNSHRAATRAHQDAVLEHTKANAAAQNELALDKFLFDQEMMLRKLSQKDQEILLDVQGDLSEKEEVLLRALENRHITPMQYSDAIRAYALSPLDQQYQRVFQRQSTSVGPLSDTQYKRLKERADAEIQGRNPTAVTDALKAGVPEELVDLQAAQDELARTRAELRGEVTY